MIGTSDGKIIRSHILPHLVAPIIVYSTLVVALEHPRRGRSVLPRPGDQGADPELGQPARDRARLLPDPAVADGLAGSRRPARDARVQPARRRSARRVRPPVDRVAPRCAGGGSPSCSSRRARCRRVRVAARRRARRGRRRRRSRSRSRGRAAVATSTTPAGCARTRASATRASSPTRISGAVADRVDGTLAPGAKGYSLRPPTRGNDSIAGSVDGSAVQDSCDAADEEPGWSGTTRLQSGPRPAHERTAGRRRPYPAASV